MKTRNHGTLTEAAFWRWIRQILRRASLKWKPRNEARKRVCRPYTGPNKRRKKEYRCERCGRWFSDKEIEVDHKIPAGSLTCAGDLPLFVSRLFCEVDGYQVLCKEYCHKLKTKEQRH